MTKTRSVLFDLDGTLLDTAADIIYVINQVRREFHFPELPYATLRPAVGEGVAALLKAGKDIDVHHDYFPSMVDKCFELYSQHATNTTRLFPDMNKVLDYLDDANILWGIVTNKPKRFTFDILKELDLETRAACIVCGDTLAKAKPDPEPIWYACDLIQRDAAQCIFIGDSHTDARASKAAGTKLLVALYGYIGNQDDPFTWQADGYLREPADIITWLREHSQQT